MKTRTREIVVALCYLIAASLSCTPSFTRGQRLITFQIESRGNVLYEGIRGVPDTTPVAKMWDVLGDVSFAPTATEGEHSDDGALEGDVVIRIKHVGKVLATVSLKKLTLQRSGPTNAWSLGSAEVQRVKASESK